ncbi:MAG: hypothetical protein K9H84_06900 [Bacteroidales bacterium]|nr:hypothetical protein [Bacteroidales bacterium]
MQSNLNKYITLLTLIFLSVSAFQLSAQYKTYDLNKVKPAIEPGYYRYSMLKFNPLPVLHGHIPMSSEYRLIYETSFGPSHSINFGAAYMGKNTIIPDAILTDYITDPDNTEAKGFRLIANYRYIYSKNDCAPSGMYLGPEISFAKMDFEQMQPGDQNNKALVEHFYAILKWGYQGRISGNFYFDLYAGAGYKNNSYSNNLSGTQYKVFEGKSLIYDFPLKLSLGFNMGILI